MKLYELYKVQLELTVTITISLVFFYANLQTKGGSPFDLMIFPWIIWVIKKSIEVIIRFKDALKVVKEKFNVKFDLLN